MRSSHGRAAWPAASLVIPMVSPHLHPLTPTRAWMRGCVSEEYRPRGVKDEVDEHGFQMQHVVQVCL